jgi:outer membrane protein OmpA-like peptidoglycan-associated protein
VDGLNANADYEFSVLACDTDDNCSDRSQPADATTDAISPLISTPAAILTGQSVVFAVSHLSGAAVVEAGDLAEGVAGLDVDGLTVTVTTVHGFSGVLTQPLIVTDEGSQVAVDAVVTVNPDAASRAAYKPLSATSARITWTSGAGATRATVRVNGKSVCTTSATTCTVRSLLGPASVVTVTESGHDATSATPVRAAYSASKVPLGTSHFVGDSAVLTSASVKALRTLSSRIAAAGITRLTVHGYTAAQTRATRTPGQLRLSQLRAHAVSDALVAMLDARGLHVRITLVAEGGAHPIASNATYTGRTENRRAEVVIG